MNMPNTSYQIQEETPLIVSEPSVVYQRVASSYVSPNALDVMEMEFSGRITPNVPFHGTQDEWWEHIHRIEAGPFYTIEEADREFELWKKEYLTTSSSIPI